jgi:hypothetical protein
MALCDPKKLEHRTNFPFGLIKDWKEQAILYILTGDILIENYKMVSVTKDTKVKTLLKGNTYRIFVIEVKN